jgi:hypothetical protein
MVPTFTGNEFHRVVLFAATSASVYCMGVRANAENGALREELAFVRLLGVTRRGV